MVQTDFTDSMPPFVAQLTQQAQKAMQQMLAQPGATPPGMPQTTAMLQAFAATAALPRAGRAHASRACSPIEAPGR
jgi:hypothetical protein